MSSVSRDPEAVSPSETTVYAVYHTVLGEVTLSFVTNDSQVTLGRRVCFSGRMDDLDHSGKEWAFNAEQSDRLSEVVRADPDLLTMLAHAESSN